MSMNASALANIVGADNLLTDPAKVAYFATDVYRAQVMPGAVARPGTIEELVVLSSLAGCALYLGGCAAVWRLRQRDVALAGTPVRLPALGLWVVLGIASMAACIALASWTEIGGLFAVIAGSVLLYWAVRRR